MKIQINTGNNIEGSESLTAHITQTVESAFGRNSVHITRVVVHLSDERSHKANHDEMRCMMEARLAGHQPIAVKSEGGTMDQAIGSATDKLTRLIETTLGRQRHQKER